jgi:hypothetical protein
MHLTDWHSLHCLAPRCAPTACWTDARRPGCVSMCCRLQGSWGRTAGWLWWEAEATATVPWTEVVTVCMSAAGAWTQCQRQ